MSSILTFDNDAYPKKKKKIAMAGNIIPAIATTNAIIAGMMVMLAFKILNKALMECKTVSRQNELGSWDFFVTVAHLNTIFPF